MLTEEECAVPLGIPSDPNHLVRCFILTRSDQDLVVVHCGDASRIGIAVQLALLSHPGMTLANPGQRPEPLVAFA